MLSSKNILLTSVPLLFYYYLNRRKKTNSDDFFKNKSIIITGASQGIGKELATILSQYDVKLFLLARSFKTHHKHNTFYYKCDCSNNSEVEIVFKSITKIDNNPDILIHCAGSGDWKFITEMKPKEIIDCIKTPLLASMFCTREFLNNIKLDNKENNDNHQVVFVQSPASIQPWKSSTAYSTSRIGMKGFTEALRCDYHDKNIEFKEAILGKVNSNYFKNNPYANKRFPVISKIIPEISPDTAANVIIDLLKSNSQTSMYPPIIKILKSVYYVFPSLVTKCMNSLGYAQE